jgi:hypothetical protein
VTGPSRRTARPRGDADTDGALEAMTAEELRSFLRAILQELDDDQGAALRDGLLSRAAKGSAGWKPRGPSARVAAEARRFADAARRAGSADPARVDELLRAGTTAFLSGDHDTARAVFEALLPSIADGDIYLGQHEMVEEVLTADVHECAARYVVSVYTITPLQDRAKALCAAMDAVQGASSLLAPLEEMERAATGPLPELDAFLPTWVRYLEHRPRATAEWEGDRDRWLREAVLRLEGVAGLERIARKSKKPEALWAWCETLLVGREWAEALRACEEAATLVRQSEWRGGFLDRAALAARELGRPDAAARLEAAWAAAPSLVRLLRWLDAGGPTEEALLRRASDALARCPQTAGRQRGLLHLLTGDVRAAARLLEKAPGLGWSAEDHPGRVLFPAIAGLLARGTKTKLSAELAAELEENPHDPWGLEWDEADDEGPRLATPSAAVILGKARSTLRMSANGREAMHSALRLAAAKRVEGILGNKRRRYYRHAALLVACCLELAPAVGKEAEIAAWVGDLRRTYSRFHAFQEECERALASIAS